MYFTCLGATVAIVMLASFLDFKHEAFWRSIGLVGLITPFVCAKQAWDRAEADLKKFTKRTEVANKKELPEILLDNDQT